MAINIPKEIKQQDYSSIIFGLAIIVVVFLLAVWPGFLKTDETDRPIVLPEREIPTTTLNWGFLEDLYCPMSRTGESPTSREHCQKEEPACFWNAREERCYRRYEAFEDALPLSLDCPMRETEGLPDSEEDCLEETGCFWNPADELCYRIFEDVPPLNCPMKKTLGSRNSEDDCLEEPGCFWDSEQERCYKVLGSSNPFLSHFFLLY